MDTAVIHAGRLLAVYPPGEFTVHVIDPAGSGAAALAPLTSSGVLDGPPAAGAAGVAAVLTKLTQRVDLVQMAVRGGAAESLPPDLDTAEQLLIVNDFPHGFDDRAVTQLRYLADEGPSVGVHLLMVADREDADAYGPVLDPSGGPCSGSPRSRTATSPTPGSDTPGRTSPRRFRRAAAWWPRRSNRWRRPVAHGGADLRSWAPFTFLFTFPWSFLYSSGYRRGVLPYRDVPVNTDRNRSRGVGPRSGGGRPGGGDLRQRRR